MSLLMTQTEHYPMNNHENSPTQSSMGYFPPGHGYNNNVLINNQWQQITRSPNSMGNNGSPMNMGMMPSSSMNNMPATPSPLLNSVNSNTMMSSNIGMSGACQRPNSVKRSLSVQQQPSNVVPLTLRNPFEEDLESRPASRQQMPPPTNTNQRLYFDMITEFKSQFYTNINDPMVRYRLPMAYNTIGSERYIRYPIENVNRSMCVHIQKPMMPPMPMQMPVTSAAPPQAPTTSKRRISKKQKEQQEQMQSSQVLNGIPNFSHGISPMAMDLNRPCSSHDMSNSPGALPIHLKNMVRSPTTDGFGHLTSKNIKLMPNEKCATENYPCLVCNIPITNEKRGIRCTAMNQGCFNCYHFVGVKLNLQSYVTLQECSGLNLDAYNQLINDPRCEWVCQLCQKSRQILFHA